MGLKPSKRKYFFRGGARRPAALRAAAELAQEPPAFRPHTSIISYACSGRLRSRREYARAPAAAAGDVVSSRSAALAARAGRSASQVRRNGRAPSLARVTTANISNAGPPHRMSTTPGARRDRPGSSTAPPSKKLKSSSRGPDPQRTKLDKLNTVSALRSAFSVVRMGPIKSWTRNPSASQIVPIVGDGHGARFVDFEYCGFRADTA